MTALFFEGMYGLGDNIYQRAFLRHYPGAYLRTPWPELYSDLEIHCVRSETVLRTQQKNENRTDCTFFRPPENSCLKRIFYGPMELAKGSIINAFRQQFNVSGTLVFDLPHFDNMHPSIPAGRRIAVIRPVTERSEWKSGSRNPDPYYLVLAAQILREQGFFVVSVADIEPGIEWIVGPEPSVDLALHHGEISITTLCALYRRAACVVSSVGFSVPMAIASHTPLIVVGGGRGGHNAPEIITDPAMSLEKTRWLLPDHYCRCTSASHQCDKVISHFEEKFYGALNEIVL